MSCREHHANGAEEVQKRAFEAKMTQTSLTCELKLPHFTV